MKTTVLGTRSVRWSPTVVSARNAAWDIPAEKLGQLARVNRLRADDATSQQVTGAMLEGFQPFTFPDQQNRWLACMKDPVCRAEAVRVVQERMQDMFAAERRAQAQKLAVSR